MLFQVPQFIETEDKVVGPFSLRQFLYIGGAIGLTFLLYFLLQTWLSFVLAVPVCALGAALAFYKPNGQPLMRVLFSAFSFYFKPQTYVWQPHAPQMKKDESALQSLAGGGLSWESIVSGLALRRMRERVQTGTAETTKKLKRSLGNVAERYTTIQKLTGDRYLAKRVDYR